MERQIRPSSTDNFGETRHVATELEKLAGAFIISEAGRSEEQQLKKVLLEEYLKVGTEPRLKEENQKAISEAKSSKAQELESSVIRSHANGRGFHGEPNGCPDYALIHARMMYDYFAKPTNVPLIWPSCENGTLKKLELTVPYVYDGPKRNKTIELP